ncbi:MAG: phosphatidate cytidylyltransferase [Bacilli bacterium]|jgi:phosphatidate cytidylyltransferase|nr:phosphatidate cytidylyltransferase [Bacilli bacterium]
MKQRLFSALGMILLAIPLIILGNAYFTLGILLVGILGLHELFQINPKLEKVPFLIRILYYFAFFMIVLLKGEYSSFFGLDYKLLGFFFLLFGIFSLIYPKEEFKTTDVFYFLGFCLFLGLACRSVIFIRSRGLFFFLYFVMTSILTDTFAFVFGTLIGVHKMAPNISPKKTWEGTIMGVISATILDSAFYFSFVSRMNVGLLLLLTFLLSSISVLGDLFFSKIKREHHVKDFSNLIPGHGGILDRFDSVIFAALAFWIMVSYF